MPLRRHTADIAGGPVGTKPEGAPSIPEVRGESHTLDSQGRADQPPPTPSVDSSTQLTRGRTAREPQQGLFQAQGKPPIPEILPPIRIFRTGLEGRYIAT